MVSYNEIIFQNTGKQCHWYPIMCIRYIKNNSNGFILYFQVKWLLFFKLSNFYNFSFNYSDKEWKL